MVRRKHQHPVATRLATSRAKIKLFAILMAVVFALSLMPTGAWADPTANNSASSEQQGVLGTNHAVLNVANAKKGETYDVYRLFELASFADLNPATNQHGTDDQAEAYSYVIKADTDVQVADNTYHSWYKFLTTQGPAGTSGSKYAVLSNAEADAKDAAYFVIEKDPVTINSESYHVIQVNKSNFDNAWDDTGDRDDKYSDRSEADTDGTAAGIDYVNTASKSVVQDFAQEALKYARDNGLTVVKTLEATANGNLELLKEADNAPLGYYLVGTSMGTLVALDTTNSSVTVYEKNDEPQIEKSVLKKGGSIPASNNAMTTAYLTGDNGSTWVKNTDADVGDLVQFRTVVTMQQGADNYEIHDVMENGLTFVNGTVPGKSTDRYVTASAGSPAYGSDCELKVYLVRDATIYRIDQSETIGGAAKENYTLTWTHVGSGEEQWKCTGNQTDGCDFEIALKDWDGDDWGDSKVSLAATLVNDDTVSKVDVRDGDKIVVTYWAQVNENAIVFNNVDGQNASVTDPQKEQNLGSHADPAVKTAGFDRDGNGTKEVEGITVPVPTGDTGDVKKDNNYDERNTNHTVLTYGAKSYTRWEKATVTTYQFDIVKTNEYTTATAELLKDAEFKLYKATTDSAKAEMDAPDAAIGADGFTPAGQTSAPITYYQEKGTAALQFNAINNEAGAYLHKSDVAGSDTLTTTNTAELHLEGLEAGTYLLVEAKAPNGYNKLAHPIAITVTGGTDSSTTSTPAENEGKITTVFSPNSGANATTVPNGAWDAKVTAGTPATYTSESNGGIQVVNQTGQELPSTGGIGTTIFYMIGGALVVGSAIMLVTKRRMASES